MKKQSGWARRLESADVVNIGIIELFIVVSKVPIYCQIKSVKHVYVREVEKYIHFEVEGAKEARIVWQAQTRQRCS